MIPAARPPFKIGVICYNRRLLDRRKLTVSRWNSVAIYGVGLIGGSIGMALRARKLADRVVGLGRNDSSSVKSARW